MKKITSWLLLCAMITSLMACGSEKEEKVVVNDENRLGIELSDLTKKTLDESIIMKIGSSKYYAKGQLQKVEGAAPEMLSDELYIPARMFGTTDRGSYEWNEEYRIATVQYDGKTIELPADKKSIKVDGQEQAVENSIIAIDGEVMVSLEDFCESVGEDFSLEKDLILAGDWKENSESIDETEKNFIVTILQSKLAKGEILLMENKETYRDKANRSTSIIIDESRVPYSSPAEELVGIVGDMYIEDLVIKPSEDKAGYQDVSMTIYNIGYTYGSLEVYDADDKLKEVERIDPYGGLNSSIVKNLNAVAILCEDIYKAIDTKNLAYLNHKSSNNHTRSDIQVEVPEGGYIFITGNPYHSDYVAAYNYVHLMVEIYGTTKSCASLWTEDVLYVNYLKELEDYLIKELFMQPDAITQLVADYFRIVSDVEHSQWDMDKYSDEVAKRMLESVKKQKIDIPKLIESANNHMKDTLFKTVSKKLIPLTSVAFAAWDVINNASNLTCLIMDIESSMQDKSLIIEVDDWKGAYADLLKGMTGSGDTFQLAYMTDDNVPELVVRDFRTSDIYTFDGEKVVNTSEYSIASLYGLVYGQFTNLLYGAYGNEGTWFYSFEEFKNYQRQSKYTFSDNSVHVGEATGFSINNKVVSKEYFDMKLDQILESYKAAEKDLGHCSNGYGITDENIKKYLGK